MTDHQAVSEVLQTDTSPPHFSLVLSLIGSDPLWRGTWSATMAARYVIFCMANHQLSPLKYRPGIVPCSPLFMNPQISAGCYSTAFYLQSLTIHAGCCTQHFICKLFITACLSVCLSVYFWPFIRVVHKKVLIHSVHPHPTKVSLIAVVSFSPRS